MLNIVDNYSADTAVVSEEDGVVAIEYVVVASATVIALVALWGAFGKTLTDKLAAIINNIKAA